MKTVKSETAIQKIGKYIGEYKINIKHLKDIIDKLQEDFPIAFPKKPAPKIPLKYDIEGDLRDWGLKNNISKEEIVSALQLWTRGKRYWRAVLYGTYRFGLNGKIEGKVMVGQRRSARKKLICQKIKNTFPYLFSSPTPLAINIHVPLRNWGEVHEISHRDIELFLKNWCNSIDYLKCLTQRTIRYSIDGCEDGTISSSEKQYALKMLKKRW